MIANRWTRHALWIAAVALLAPPVAAPSVAPRGLRLYKIPLGGRPVQVAAADVTGDGLRDLVISHETPDGRRLSIVRQRPGGRFPVSPDQQLTPPAQAVAFMVADLAATAGEELGLLCTDGVRLYRRTEQQLAATPERLLAARGFVDVAPAGALARWDGLADLDADGRPDLLIPQRAGYLLAFQGPDRAFSLLQAVPVTPEERILTRSFHLFEIDLAGSVRMLPRLLPADFDGDGRTDLLTLRRARLTGFLQQPSARFAPEPSFSADIAFLRPRIAAGTADEFERKRASFANLDADGRADLVVIATEGTVGLFSSIKTAVTVFRGRAGALFPARPDQVLLLPGAPVRTQIRDLTGDGRPDLLATTVRTDLLGAVLSGLSVTTRIYRGVAGGFAPKPILEETVTYPAKALDRRTGVVQGHHGADCTGDRLPDRAEWDPAGHVRIFATVRGAGGRLTIGDTPWAEALAPTGAVAIDATPVTDRAGADLLLMYPDAVAVAIPERRR